MRATFGCVVVATSAFCAGCGSDRGIDSTDAAVGVSSFVREVELPSQRMRVRFDETGAQVAFPGADLRVGLRAIGRTEMKAVGKPSATHDGALAYAYAGVTERWTYDDIGLEQTFVVDARPAGNEPLRLEVALGARVSIAVDAQKTGASIFAGERMIGVLSRLSVVDAHGRHVDARLASARDGYAIVVDDADATYPLVIDPTMSTRLQIAAPTKGEQFGQALAADGNTLLVGAPGGNAAYVFTSSAGSWSLQAKLAPTDANPDDQFGYSVAISGDTAVVGAPDGDPSSTFNAGAAYVFVRSGTSWSLQQKVLPTALVASAAFGRAVAIDGSTIVVGAPSDGSGEGYAFVRSGSTWTQQAKLPHPATCCWGNYVAVAGDIALLTNGAVLVERRTGTSWATEQTLTVPSGTASGPFAVRGSTIVIEDYNNAYVYSRPASTWISSVTAPNDGQVGLAFDGTNLLVRRAPWGAGRFDVRPKGTGSFAVARTIPFVSTTDSYAPNLATANGIGFASSNETIDVYTDLVGLAKGTACGEDLDCATGFCRDGVCCDTSCGGSCQACDVMGSAGTCTNVTGAPHGMKTCGNYASCTAGVCDTTCTTSSSCAKGFMCASGACVPQKSNGTACTDGSECTSGFCADGRCCTTACGGQCEACDVSGSEGYCIATLGAPHGTRPACTGDHVGGTCGLACRGDTSKCTYGGAGVSCGAATCSAGVLSGFGSCDGAGVCSVVPHSCGSYACASTTACKTKCASDSDCLGGVTCTSGHCGPLSPLGSPCGADTQCLSGHCTEGVCCESALCGLGTSCATDGNPGKCAKSSGAPCTSAADCGSGFCVDSVCCDAKCDGQCEACDVSGSIGRCVPVSGAPHPGRPPCEGGDAICGTFCRDDRTKCTPAPSSAPCGVDSCVDGIATTAGNCDGSGACLGSVASCAPFACGTGSCKNACATNADCASPNAFCDDDKLCKFFKPDGSPCTVGKECAAQVCTRGACGSTTLPSPPLVSTPHSCAGPADCPSGFCVEGVCCDSECSGACESCVLPESPGLCRPVPLGLDPKLTCSGGRCEKTCSGTGHCVSSFVGAQCAKSSCTGPSTGTGPAFCKEAKGECPNSAAVPFDCAPYACSAPAGACLSRCDSTVECAPGFICDPSNHLCRSAPPPDSSGGCNASARPAGKGGIVVLLALLVLFARRRSPLLLAMFALGCGRSTGTDLDAGAPKLESAYAIRSEAGVLRAHNQEQQLDVAFHSAGAVIARGDFEVHVELRRFGRRDALHDVAPVQPRAAGDRAEYARSGLVEWFVNGPRGIEQGFTISSREPGNGPLVTSLSVGLPVAISKDGASASIGSPSKHLLVDALAVRDAGGRAIPARFVSGAGSLDIEIDDSNATYPLVVDPTYTNSTETVLDPDPRAATARYGAAVARTSTTVVVGAPDDDGAVAGSGAVYVFTGSGSSWQLQARLAGAGLAKGDGYGSAVAISADTMVVGVPNAGGGSGEVDVYLRSGTTWSLQQKIAGTGGDQLGLSVAIDGNTLVAGTFASGADVYVRSGTTWALQATLDASGVPGIVGSPVSISGSIAVVGGPSKASAGEAYVFVRSGTTWTREATLQGDASVPGERFATSLAISGSTVLVGAPSANYGTGTDMRTGAGAIYAFVRSGTTWTKQATISGSDLNNFGTAVALDGDQGIAANGTQGYLFHRTGTTWTRDGSQCCSIESVAIAGTEGVYGEPTAYRWVSSVIGGSVGTNSGRVESTPSYSLIEPNDSATQYGKIAGTSGYLVTAGVDRHFTFFRNVSGTWVLDGRMTSPSPWWTTAVYAATPTRFAVTDGTNLWIYVRSSSWTLESTVTVPLGSANYLAMDDSTVALSDGNSVLVWTRSGSSWISDVSVPVAGQVTSLSVSGSIAVGFAYATTSGKSSAGSGAIYTRGASAWTLEANLVAPDPYFGDNFGASIAIDAGTVAIGAPYADPASTPNTGAVYVFTRSGTTWTQQAKLASHAPSAGQQLGGSVSLLGNVLVAGGGATEVFQRSGTTWSYARSLPNYGTWSVSNIGGATASDGALHVVSPVVGLVKAAKCSFDGDCASGFCVDGVCCDAACKGNCSACDVAGSIGTCTAVTGPIHAPGYYGRTCGNYAVCSAGACATSCTSNTDCYYGFRCDGGKCVESNGIGVACSDNKDCKSGACADGVCCDSSCGSQCEACDLPGQVGHCSQVNGSPHGSRPPCASSGVCGPRCGANRYTCAPAPTGTNCSDDGCAGGVETHASTCDGAGACNDVPKSCGAYACGGASCKTSCTTSADCNVGNACKSGECKPVAGLGIPCMDGSVCPSGFCVDKVCCAESVCGAGESCATAGRKGLCAKKNGTSCSADADCGSGHCVDGVCCNSSCNQQCEACDRPGSEGTCVPVLGPPHGTRPACMGGGDAICGVACRGNRAGCEAAKLETPCGSDKCTDGIEAKASTCDGVGNCKTKPRACSPFRCGDKACRTTCTTGDDCIADAECHGGVCVLKASGPVADRGAVTSSFQSCTNASECPSGNCVEGVCCDKPCSGVCESCALPGSPGVCTPTPYGLDPKGACAAGACVKTCDGKGACVDAFPGAICAPNRCTGDATGVSAASCSAKDGACPAPEARIPFDCAPYACSAAFGTCFADCKDSSQCAPGFVCDNESLSCKAGTPADDGGGGCATSRGTRGSALFGMILLALGLSRGARRRI